MTMIESLGDITRARLRKDHLAGQKCLTLKQFGVLQWRLVEI
jgi:hypothetical protein